MRSVVWVIGAPAVRVASWALLAATVAGCSSESTRFGDPLGSPFASRGNSSDATGSVHSAPSGRVAAQPLPPPPVIARPAATPTYQSGGYMPQTPPPPPPRTSAYAPPAQDVTGSVPRPAPRAAGWNWDGGTPVTVSAGDTVEGLSRKYGVPPAAIRQANGLGPNGHIAAGQRLVVPRYDASSMAAMPKAPPAQTAATTHVVAPGETMSAIAKRYRRSITEIAAANRIAPHAMLKMGDKLVIPGSGGAPAPAPTTVASAAPQLRPPAVAAPAAYTPAAPAAPQIVMQRPAASPPQLSQPATEAVAARTITPTAPTDDDDATNTTANGPLFRWPVRGHVISSYGSKVNGATNDGVNLSVPEGTQVRAAGDGVVAYAGSELKGYGNLVLIRHADGYVTAYAHASEIMVKRNDTVRRGQVIAKSGQTGQVATPQLHFEIRKGSAPIDPRPLLPPGA